MDIRFPLDTITYSIEVCLIVDTITKLKDYLYITILGQ